MSTEKLKPCPNPWCISKSVPLTMHGRAGWRTVCGCGVQTGAFPHFEEAITAWNTRPSPDREGVARAIVDAVAKHFTANERAYALSRFEAAERDVGAMLSLMGTAPAELADLSARAAQGEWRAVEGIDPRFWFVQAADEHGHWSDVDVESPDNAKAIADAVNYVRAMLSASPVEG